MTGTDIILIMIGTLSLILLFAILIRLARMEKSDTGAPDLSPLMNDQFAKGREEVAKSSRELREELQRGIAEGNKTLATTLTEMGKGQTDQLSKIQEHIKGLTDSNQHQIDKLQKSIGDQLRELQSSNEKKLDEMRKTVDEKLQSTLEKRLGESFKLVSDRLEAVQRGLGEMQSLSKGVDDLQKVLTNVKARGAWGEVQLGAILEQMLTPNQYEKNVKTKQGSNEHVEFAIILPGKEDNQPVYLPVDAKFPQEDYLRLVEATQQGDVEVATQSRKALLRSIRNSAKDIHNKYVDPPHTTDFAILFLPTESLFAEVLQEAGLMEEIQQNYRVSITGPTTFSAAVNSLRLGFRTLAIEKQSAEVWQVLSAVKTEFGKFGDVLAKVKKQLATAANTIEATEIRTRVMESKLKSVESLPEDEAGLLLDLEPDEIDTE